VEDHVSEPSVNAKGRLLREAGTSDKSALPTPAKAPTQSTAPPVSIAPPPPAAPVRAEPIFLGDSADGADLLNASQIVQPLAHLCVTPQVQTPFLAAILGPSGAGKTFALRRLAQIIEQLSASSATARGQAVQRVLLARVDASIGVEAPVAIASAAYAALDRESGDVDYSGLLDEIRHAGGDPHRAASAASDRHDDLVRKLEAERAQRDEVEAKRARLADALAFDTPGSRLDVFARTRRGTIEAQLRRFGLTGSDADSSYRNLARDVSTLGAGARAAVVIRSMWAYGSQARLLLWGVFAFVLAFILRFLHGDTATSAIEQGSDSLKPAGDWVAAHGNWFDRAAQILFILGALAIALNLWRALGFSNLLLRGARLLTQETRERRQDLEARAARLNQRVATLTAETDAAANRAEAASQRAGGRTSIRAPGPEFLETSQAPSGAAREFLTALGARIGHSAGAGPAPDRLIVVVDNLDALSPTAAVSWIDAAQGVIGPGSIGLLAFDPSRLAVALGGPPEVRRRLGKWLQVTVNLPARKNADGELVVARLLSASEHSAPAPDAAIAAALVEPLSATETALLAALAPLAAHSPRDAKRFLNAYRLARCSNSPRPVMALMQAVAFAGDDVQAAMLDRLTYGSGELTDLTAPAALVDAVRATRVANNGSISIEEARAAAEIALRYALPL
jgi:ABC-type Na+ transport system ATPase subunit NatA